MAEAETRADERRPAAERDRSPLQRWSHRKRVADAGEPLPSEPEATAQAANQTAPESTVTAAAQAAGDEQQTDAPAPLPELDTLGADSDYAGFMAPEVEPDLRRAALRRLFALPQFALRDGLDDYDHDFTQFEGLGDIVTHEMKRMAAREAQRLAQQALQSDADEPVESLDPLFVDQAHEAAVVDADLVGRTDPEPDPDPEDRTV